jgi:hypothetical protein
MELSLFQKIILHCHILNCLKKLTTTQPIRGEIMILHSYGISKMFYPSTSDNYPLF